MAFKRGQFQINGKHSEEFSAYMRDRPKRLSAGRVIELRERPGNDSIVMDFAYYKNVEWQISCYAKADGLESVSHLEDRIRSWLDMSNYSDFTCQFDEHYIYQAIVVSGPEFSGTKKNGVLVPFDFTISLRPFKSSRNGFEWMTNETMIHNVERYPSKPKIQIWGSGDISFWINDESFKLTDIGSEIVIDSQLEESYRIVDGVIESQDHKTQFIDFPILPVGWTTIKWEGDVKKFNLMPRWWTKI
ncbi:phage tail protein [Enterococcus sp. DIV1297f]|uniref:phage tail protein n=1 Tax=Enterococcus sp. DIV1297f TaxID=2774691 RepID=UPI003D26C187